MIASWANKYIGIPFRWRGADRTGVDCYGLVRMVYRDEFHVAIPSLDDEEADSFIRPQGRAGLIDSERSRGYWRHVDEGDLEHGDVVLLRLQGFPAHLGLYVGHGKMLHADERGASCIERTDSPLWRNRIMGYFRYQEGRGDE